jgi:hypothetical protein
MFRVEVDLMDKIARRPYLHPYNSFASRNYRGDDEYDHDDHEGGSNDENSSMLRPPGVPHTLRILALDMPEMKLAFSGGTCIVSRRHEYPSGVAATKHCVETAAVRSTFSDPAQVGFTGLSQEIPTEASDDSLAEQQEQQHVNNTLATSTATFQDRAASSSAISSSQPAKLVRVHYRVEQKSVAQSMLHCYNPKTDQVAVQVLMGSIAQLNPNHIRPSKRRQSKIIQQQQSQEISDNEHKDNIHDASIAPDQFNDVAQAYSKIKDELEAPWHQYAWMDELELRVSAARRVAFFRRVSSRCSLSWCAGEHVTQIGGRVRFGAPMTRASSLSRMMLRRNNVYQPTVSSSQTALDWFLAPSLQTDPAGMDGKDQVGGDEAIETNWASQRPHAVVANGAELRKVPGSLRLLQRLCQQEQVPLFIYRDRHAWRRCHVHDNLNELLYNLRQMIQLHVVRKALRCYQHDFLFASGRMFGRAELEFQSQMMKRIQEFKSVAHRYLNKFPSEMDWSKLYASELEKKLRERQVITTKFQLSGVSDQKQYTPAMVTVCKKCISDHTAEISRKTTTVVDSAERKV